MSSIFHFCGHIISNDESGRFPKSYENKVQNKIERFLTNIQVNSCYGSLASGADILLAEAMVNKGASLHAVLPFDQNKFIDMSVAYSGKKWVKRFHNLLNNAQNVTQIFFNKPYDEVSFSLCTEVAIGLCLLESYHSSNKKRRPKQLCIWDKQKTQAIAGTYIDMLRWQQLKIKSRYINSNNPEDVVKFKHFEPVGFDFVQPLSIVIYDNKNDSKVRVKSLTDLINFIESDSVLLNKTIDFDCDLFGQEDLPTDNIISSRALGHIAYHCHINNKSQILTRILDKIKHYA